MKKIISIMLISSLAVATLTGCSSQDLDISAVELNNGTYRAEFKDYDSEGWKDYVEVTISEGELNEVVFDAISEKDGTLKSEDESYKIQMDAIKGTYPAKFNKDLINQFIDSGKVSAVDIVAGATESTGDFKTLIVAAVTNSINDVEATAVIENIDVSN